MRALAVLSLHTSPLAQPGTGDGGGMNVYVRELSAHLARSGGRVEVFTRADAPDLPATVTVEPGMRVHHVAAGPPRPVAKEQVPELVEQWTAGVAERLEAVGPVDCLHANYWLSGVAGHSLKHRFDLPLISTFHTLDRVKAEVGDGEEPLKRAAAEAAIIDCSDVVLASCTVEAEQLETLYGADPARIEIVAPGVEHAFFTPGDQSQARRAVGLPADVPLVLFVGRIQPLKSLTVAVEAVAAVATSPPPVLVVVGGPSGPRGAEELGAAAAAARRLGVDARVHRVPPQPHETLSTYYRAADVCVVPSRSESFGLVALEAAACGTPVVASAVGGLTTLVEDGVTGYLVEEGGPAAYAARLEAVLGDRQRAAEMGWAARARAREYTWAAAAAAMRRVHRRVTSRQLVACQ
ncbi:MAG TPA: glycosyltransferase [Acidimicrobiales bacterium]|nr:glycosyltransferase [Acidimicrobiales bacterium]